MAILPVLILSGQAVPLIHASSQLSLRLRGRIIGNHEFQMTFTRLAA